VTVNNLAFKKIRERARPGYYGVDIGLSGKPTVQVELTATRRSAMERYTFPNRSAGNLVLDVTSVIPLGGDPNAQHVTKAEVTIIDDHTVSGSASFVGGWNPAPYTIYFFAMFDRPVRQSGTWKATLSRTQVSVGSTHLSETGLEVDHQNRMGMFASFDTATSPVVKMKLAVSMIGVNQAKSNLAEEMSGWNFDTITSLAAEQWRSVLSTIRVEGGTEEQRRVFYSSFYRAHQMPHDLTGETPFVLSILSSP
jgi:putative alpha-1,2-mannosidase